MRTHSHSQWLAVLVVMVAVGCGTTAATSLDASSPDTDTGLSDAGDVQLVEEFDVPYTPPAGGESNLALLDVYYLPDGKPKRLMVFVHGGSWVGGDKSNLRDTTALIRWFIDRGFVVAAPNFRLASRPPGPAEVTYTDQATDLAFSLSWLKENGATYGVTEPGVVLMGFSSGAHLVALLGADARYLELARLAPDHLAASISLDVHAYDVPYALTLMQGSDIQTNIPVIEFLFGDTEAEQLLGSPSSYAAEAAVPATLLVSAEPSASEGSHGYISSQASQRYRDLLQAAGHAVSWIHYDNETHESLVTDFGTVGDGPTAAVSTFLDGLSL